MKRIIIPALLLVLIIGNIGALDTESYNFIDYLLKISGPGEPEIYEDGVIFTASAGSRRVGIAFAHEGFARVYWFQRLLVPKDQGPPPEDEKKPRPEVYEEKGLLFYVYTPPEDLGELSYRLVVDGLWTADPLNPRLRHGGSGVAESVVALPPKPAASAAIPRELPGFLSLSYRAAPGEKVTAAGSFNNWDPFMYELRETSPGLYTLSLPLPPGTYQYVFFHRGERILDPNNLRRVYTREGKTASETIVR